MTVLYILPLELAEMPSAETIIKVVGVGGGGSNAVNYIYNKDIEGVSCVAINTDAKSLALLNLPHKLPIARHGSGANPAVSKQAAEEHEEDIRSAIKGAEMVFITAGMGKGTGTGASPVVAKIAQELGILTVGVVTIPFKFEGNSSFTALSTVWNNYANMSTPSLSSPTSRLKVYMVI